MSIHFAVGKRVVCIDDVFHNPNPGFVCPVRRAIYTIREVVPLVGHVGLRLEELDNSRLDARWTDGEKVYTCEIAFNGTRFRPVRETSIDCFAALLAKPPVRLRENA